MEWQGLVAELDQEVKPYQDMNLELRLYNRLILSVCPCLRHSISNTCVQLVVFTDLSFVGKIIGR